MKPNASAIVGDVEERQDDWSFAVVDADQKARICFVFKGRKDATVSRRLMKEILARSIAMSVAELPTDEMSPALPAPQLRLDNIQTRDHKSDEISGRSCDSKFAKLKHI